VSIASELVTSLASCIHGQKLSPTYLASICQRLAILKGNKSMSEMQPLPKNQHARALSIQRPRSITPLPSIPLNQQQQHHNWNLEQKRILNNTSTISTNNIHLDYLTIKRDLFSHQPDCDKKKALLLQALKQKLIKQPLPRNRKTILQELITHDLFNLHTSPNLITHVITAESLPLSHEHLAKLLNVMASDAMGRTYLLTQPLQFIPVLLKAVREESMDTAYRQHLLGVLQKTSLKRQAQSLMIQNDWVQYLFDLFEDLEGLSEFTIEYGSALLMNLCLRTTGKKVCLQNSTRTLRILNELLEHDNLQVNLFYRNFIFFIEITQP
jgi:hypothetical protein